MASGLKTLSESVGELSDLTALSWSTEGGLDESISDSASFLLKKLVICPGAKSLDLQLLSDMTLLLLARGLRFTLSPILPSS